MQNTRNITKASYEQLDWVRQGLQVGIDIEYEGERGEKKTLRVTDDCTFQLVQAGIVAERQFTGENTGRGFRVLVGPTGTGTVTLIDANVMTSKA